MIILFAALSLVALKEKPAYGIWALFNTVLLPATKGNPNHMTRYVSIAFPAFVVLAAWGEQHRRLHQTIVVAFAITLSLLMALWSQYYIAV
jgi:hypothetical protein